jgi:hypothetical protein
VSPKDLTAETKLILSAISLVAGIGGAAAVVFGLETFR